MENFGGYWLHILITLVFIPIIVMFYNRNIKKADIHQEKREKDKERTEEDWKEYVKGEFGKMSIKITSYCAENHREHEELYHDYNKINTRLTAVETTHHQRGCDQPYMRREMNHHKE